MEGETRTKCRDANNDTSTGSIEGTFAAMVGRWLVKGQTGEWKLASKNKLSGSPPNYGRQCQMATNFSPRATRIKSDVSEYVEGKSTSPTIVKRMPKTQGRVLVLNNKSFSSPNHVSKPASHCRDTSFFPKRETRLQAPGVPGNTASQPSSGRDHCDIKKEAKAVVPAQATRTSCNGVPNGIPMLPNGKKKCVVEGCYRAAYQRRLCPAHGGRDKCRVQDCKNYSYTRVCQAHGGGKPRTNFQDQKPTHTKTGVVATERDLKASGVDTNTKSHLKKPVASSNRGVAETKQSLGEVTMKKRPKLRTKKSLNSDAWKSSDLPNLFRNVDHKRARGTEERVVSTKREKLEISTLGVVETKSRAQVATNKAAAVKVARSRPVKTEEVECKFRGCKMPVLSDGFCQKHERRERCKEKGCGHLATSKGFCSRHARRRRCEVDGCSKKSRVRGRCSQHGGKYFCRQEGCKKTAYLRGLCGAHSREAQSQTAAAWRPQSSE